MYDLWCDEIMGRVWIPTIVGQEEFPMGIGASSLLDYMLLYSAVIRLVPGILSFDLLPAPYVQYLPRSDRSCVP